MSRAIEADALFREIEKAQWYNNADRDEIAEELVLNAPTIEFEIIHCKDCKHWSRESICDGFCSEDCMRHDENFYCGYAGRRTNE